LLGLAVLVEVTGRVLGIVGLRGWWGSEAPEADGRRTGVTGAGDLAGSLDPVAVVAGASDRAGAAAVPAGRVELAGDLGVHGW